jgi:hypothetical protein
LDFYGHFQITLATGVAHDALTIREIERPFSGLYPACTFTVQAEASAMRSVIYPVATLTLDDGRKARTLAMLRAVILIRLSVRAAIDAEIPVTHLPACACAIVAVIAITEA